MRDRIISLMLALAVLAATGCLELVRRPQGPARAGRGDRAALGTTPGPVRGTRTEDGPADTSEVQDSGDPAGSGLRPVPPAVSAPARARRRRVNAYALWCLEQGLWKEARSHLQQALQVDSLSASLNNNLAIVHEHFGDFAAAMACYRKAISLDPQAAQYERNLHGAERHQKAAVDTTEGVDLFGAGKRGRGHNRSRTDHEVHRVL